MIRVKVLGSIWNSDWNSDPNLFKYIEKTLNKIGKENIIKIHFHSTIQNCHCIVVYDDPSTPFVDTPSAPPQSEIENILEQSKYF